MVGKGSNGCSANAKRLGYSAVMCQFQSCFCFKQFPRPGGQCSVVKYQCTDQWLETPALYGTGKILMDVSTRPLYDMQGGPIKCT